MKQFGMSPQFRRKLGTCFLACSSIYCGDLNNYQLKVHIFQSIAQTILNIPQDDFSNYLRLLIRSGRAQEGT